MENKEIFEKMEHSYDYKKYMNSCEMLKENGIDDNCKGEQNWTMDFMGITKFYKFSVKDVTFEGQFTCDDEFSMFDMGKVFTDYNVGNIDIKNMIEFIKAKEICKNEYIKAILDKKNEKYNKLEIVEKFEFINGVVLCFSNFLMFCKCSDEIKLSKVQGTSTK